LRQRPLVQEARLVVRSEQVDLRLADAAEQRVVLRGDVVVRSLAGGADQRAPGLLQESPTAHREAETAKAHRG